MSTEGQHSLLRALVGIIIVLLLAGLSYLAYICLREARLSKEILTSLSSADPMTVSKEIYKHRWECARFGSTKERIRSKVQELLVSDSTKILRAAITVAGSPGLGIMSDPAGLKDVRAAIKKYNATQATGDGVRETIRLEKADDGKYLVMVHTVMP